MDWISTPTTSDDGTAGTAFKLPAAPRSEWIEHRRSDGEHVGWTVLEDDGFHVVDLLGRQRTQAPVEWFVAEDAFEKLGIGYLTDSYTLLCADGVTRRVRIGEVSRTRVVVLADDFGDASVVGSKPEEFRLPFPAPESLRSLD